jgi:hypothetical protein
MRIWLVDIEQSSSASLIADPRIGGQGRQVEDLEDKKLPFGLSAPIPN